MYNSTNKKFKCETRSKIPRISRVASLQGYHCTYTFFFSWDGSGTVVGPLVQNLFSKYITHILSSTAPPSSATKSCHSPACCVPALSLKWLLGLTFAPTTKYNSEKARCSDSLPYAQPNPNSEVIMTCCNRATQCSRLLGRAFLWLQILTAPLIVWVPRTTAFTTM